MAPTPPALPDSSVQPTTPAHWRQWLVSHHEKSQGVWLVSYKAATGKRTMTYDEAVEVALCFGWIDSKPRSLDEERAMLWFSPRKKGSAWSRKNKERIARLEREGLLHEAGRKRIEAAKADGSWAALDQVEALEMPPDLRTQLRRHPGAQAHFEAFPRSAKRALLEWISSARQPGTRARRILETAEKAAQNLRANQWKAKD